MTDYDAIVIGAGHNGLTAAAILQRGGRRTLCLEKNHYTGGMAATTELFKGYQFEIAGSVLFPIPDEIYDDLGLDVCPTVDTEVMSVNIGGPDDAADASSTAIPSGSWTTSPTTTACDAVLGMAEIMEWAEAPARALGRFDVRTPPKTLDEMFACADERGRARGHPRDAVRLGDGRARPLPPRQGAAHDAALDARLPRRELDLPGAVHARAAPCAWRSRWRRRPARG